MTGPEHYQLAEVAQQAAAAMQATRQPGPDVTPVEALLDALVHATLALAAATAMNDAEGGMGVTDWNAWNEAAGEHGKPVSEVTP